MATLQRTLSGTFIIKSVEYLVSAGRALSACPPVPPSLSHRPWLPGHHGGEIIGFVVTSSGCQERASALVSDEDISVTATLREDQLVHWASLIKLTACHVQAGQEEASCSAARVSVHGPGQKRRGELARSGAEPLV